MPAIFSKQRFLLCHEGLPKIEPSPKILETQKPPVETYIENSPIVSPPMEQAGPCPSMQSPQFRSSRALKALEELVEHAPGLAGEQEPLHGLTDARLALKSYLILFELYGFDFNLAGPSKLAKAVLNVLADIAQVLRTHTWLDYFKYKNAAFFSVWNSQELPPEPIWLSRCSMRNPKYLFGGAFYGWLRRKMKSEKGFRQGFSLSVLQSKGGMPRPDKALVTAAEIKAVNNMTSIKEQVTFSMDVPTYLTPTIVFNTDRGASKGRGLHVERRIVEPLRDLENLWGYDRLTYSREYMEAQIRRTTQELYNNFHLSLNKLSDFTLPSSSANYNDARSKYGTWGSFWRLLTDDGSYSLHGLRGHLPKLEHKMTTLRDRIDETYGKHSEAADLIGPSLDDAIDATRDVIGCEIDVDEFLKVWRIFYWKCVDFAMKNEQDAFCKVVGLAESLKIRCISKGPPITYFVLKPLQVALWGHLQKTWNFELTGTPITEDLINKRFSSYLRAGGFRFHSGDYSNATDELYSWTSECAANTFMDCWERNSGFELTPFRWLLLNALTGHTYVVETKGAPTVNLPQRRGQLMGSIVSFPFLCIINMALLRAAYEITEGKRFRIQELPVWVNGDDCLTAYLNRRFPIVWEGLGKVVGFMKSVGKTYDSDEFCSINSTTFDVVDEQWKLRKYVNLRLLYGYVRSSVGASAAKAKEAHQLGPIHRKLMEMTPEDLKLAVHSRFMMQHKETLKKYPGHWFMPEYLCGLGLVDVAGIGYTLRELKLITVLRSMYNQGLDCPSLPTDLSWILYDFFHRTVREQCPLIDSYSFESYDGEESYGTAFKAVILNEFATNGFKNLYLFDERTAAEKVYAKRLKVFRRAEELLNGNWDKYSPAELDSIDYEKKVRVYPIWAKRTMRQETGLGTTRVR